MTDRPVSLLRMAEVKRRTSEAESTIWEKIKRGEFPAPVKLSARSRAWVDREIDAYIDGRIRASRKAA
jgi:prophage regulatory protein